MAWLKLAVAKLRALVQPEAVMDDIEAELHAHIEMETEALIARGMKSDEARATALRRFGNLGRVRELGYAVRGPGMIETFVQDARYGARSFAKHRGFTTIAVLTLALGIGANTAIFSLINAVLLRALPFPRAEQLMTIWEEVPSQGVAKQAVAPGSYSDLRAQQTAFAGIAALTKSEVNLTGEGGPEKLEGFAMLDDALSLLGVKPALGRTPVPEEFVRGAERVVIISHALWQQRFSGASDVLGKQVVLNDEQYSVIGVLPADYQFLNPAASFWVPAQFSASMLAYRGAHNLTVIARLKPGVTEAQSQTQVQSVMSRIAQDHPAEAGKLRMFVEPLHEHLTGGARRPFLMLLAAVGFVLLIACANLANLLLARGVARRMEVAVRVALGAARGRILLQMLTESVLLAGAGGICGLWIAAGSFSVLRQLIPQELVGSARLGLDMQVLAYTLGSSMLTGVLFGLAPAWQATRVDVNEALKQGAGRVGTRVRRLQSALVVAEVALALVLLIGAGLLIQTFFRLRQVDVGFRAENVLTLQTRLPRNRYPEHAKRTAFYKETLERVKAIPGVIAAGYTSHLPPAALGGAYRIAIEGRSQQPGVALDAGHRQITPDYFRTLGIPIRQGRGFDERDTLETQPVVVVNEALARRFFPNESPLAKTISLYHDVQRRFLPPLKIIGVVGNVKQNGLEGDVHPELYLPQPQVTFNSFSVPSYLAIRTTADPLKLVSLLREAILAADPSLPVADVHTMEARLDDLVAHRRLRMTLLAAYAGLALVLALVGIYGALSHFVTQHTNEIGLRVALGARAADVFHFVLARGMRLALAGIGLGLLVSLALTRLMQTLLFGVSASDPATFGLIASLLSMATLFACWIPSLRATKLDPLIALRYE